MNNQVNFDSLLRMAVRETYLEQVDSIPPEDKLEEILHPTNDFKNRIRAIVRRENRNEKLIRFRKAFSKVAVIIMVCISLTSASLLTAQAVRESVATTILEWHDKFTRIFIETDTQPDKLPDIRFNYIPEGFELVEEESIKNNSLEMYTYRNLNNNYIRIYINFYDDNIDNENATYYILSIDNARAIWINKQYNNQLIISVNDISFNINGNINLEEIVNIYKNIEIL